MWIGKGGGWGLLREEDGCGGGVLGEGGGLVWLCLAVLCLEFGVWGSVGMVFGRRGGGDAEVGRGNG